MAQNVSITLQNTDEGRAITTAILGDNPEASVSSMPSLTKINCPGRLEIRRDSVEAQLGRDYDLQELQLSIISLAGNVDEDDERIIIAWKN